MKNFGEEGAWAYLETAQFFQVPPIIPGTGKATDFKFGQYIQRVHLNKSPLKILEKRKRGQLGISRDHSIFFGCPLLSRGTGKGTKFKFCMHIYRLNRYKSPLKISGKVAVGMHPYIGRIAWSSLQ